MKLVIEVDGRYHFEEAQIIRDKERQTILEEMRLNFLRFHRKDMLSVIATIQNRILQLEQQKLQQVS